MTKAIYKPRTQRNQRIQQQALDYAFALWQASPDLLPTSKEYRQLVAAKIKQARAI